MTTEEQLKQLGIDTLKSTLETLKVAKDFAVEQTPILLQEILRYNLVYNSIIVSINILLLVSLFWVIPRTLRKFDNSEDTWKNAVGALSGAVYSALVLIAGLINVFRGIPIICKIYFAPRLYLIETISALIK